MRYLWFLLWSSILTITASAGEMRGIWVDAFGPGFKTKKEVKQLVDDCRKYNFNAVFVQMRKRGDAYYFPKSPNPDPRAVGIKEDYDALAEIINECHTGKPRIEVHCWAVAYFIWAFDKVPPQRNHLVITRPDLLTKDSIGQTILANGNYLDPGHPDTGRVLLDMASDIVGRYDVDGFHWDYLRYPNRDSGYNDVALSRYKKEFKTEAVPAPNDSRFSEWRRRQVDDFLRWSTAELLRIKPALVISASVFSGYKDSVEHRMADWVAWNKEGLLDASVPMDFSPDNRSIFDPRANFAITNQGCRTVWNGQGAYMNDKANTLRQLDYSRNKGFTGTLLYSYRNTSPQVSLSGKKKAEEKKFAGRAQKIVDNQDAKKVGDWKLGEFGKFYGEDYLFIKKGNGSSSVTFSAQLSVPGEYEIYEWHVVGKNRAQSVPHLIRHKDGVKKVDVDQRKNGARWNRIGSFSFEAKTNAEVTITDEISGEGDVAIADAVRFVLVTSAGKPVDEGLSEEQLARRKQQEVLNAIKERLQPTWQDTAALPWKQNPKTGIILGTVYSSAGTPVYNVKAKLEDGRTLLSEPHGKFAFHETTPGDHLLTIEFDGGQFQTNVVVKAGQVTITTIQGSGK